MGSLLNGRRPPGPGDERARRGRRGASRAAPPPRAGPCHGGPETPLGGAPAGSPAGVVFGAEASPPLDRRGGKRRRAAGGPRPRAVFRPPRPAARAAGLGGLKTARGRGPPAARRRFPPRRSRGGDASAPKTTPAGLPAGAPPKGVSGPPWHGPALGGGAALEAPRRPRRALSSPGPGGRLPFKRLPMGAWPPTDKSKGVFHLFYLEHQRDWLCQV
jgi:hypothetical protein